MKLNHCYSFLSLLFLVVLGAYLIRFHTQTRVEMFEDNQEQQPGYRFNTPVSFENKNKLRFDNEVTFEGNAHVDSNRSIRFNKAPVFEETSVIHFEKPSVDITHQDAETIKITRGKIDYLKKSLDVGNLEGGKFKNLFSSRLSGTNACTSKIWKILTGHDLSVSELCESCCSVRKEQKIEIILNKDERLHLVMKINPISSSQVQFKVFTPSQLVGLGNAAYTIYNIVSFRSTQELKCRLILTQNSLFQIQNQNYRPVRGDIVIYPTTMQELIQTDTAENADEKWGSDRRFIDWGSFNYTFPLETYTNITLNNVFKLVLQVLPEEY